MTTPTHPAHVLNLLEVADRALGIPSIAGALDLGHAEAVEQVRGELQMAALWMRRSREHLAGWRVYLEQGLDLDDIVYLVNAETEKDPTSTASGVSCSV